MSIDQLELILYDMYHMDAWMPPLFGKWDGRNSRKAVIHKGCRRAQRFYRRKNISENIGINR